MRDMTEFNNLGQLNAELFRSALRSVKNSNDQCDKDFPFFPKETLKTALRDTFRAMAEVVYSTMDELGEARDMYKVSLFPFELERVDGKPIPERLLSALKEKLSATVKVERSAPST